MSCTMRGTLDVIICFDNSKSTRAFSDPPKMRGDRNFFLTPIAFRTGCVSVVMH